MSPDRRAILGHDLGMDGDLFQTRISPGRLTEIHSGVIDFPIVKLRLPVLPVLCHLPRFVRADDFYGSVHMYNPQLTQQRLALCVNPVPSLIGKGAHRPAPSHNGRQLVGILPRFRDVVSLVLEFMPVGGKARCKIIPANLLTV